MGCVIITARVGPLLSLTPLNSFLPVTGPENGAGEANPDQLASDTPRGEPGPVLGAGDRSVTEADQVLSSESSESGHRKADNHGSKTKQRSRARAIAEPGGGFWGAVREPPPAASRRSALWAPSSSH